MVPKARGEAARRLQDAEAYKARVIADAEGEAQRFERSCWPNTRKRRKLPGERLYIEALEAFYGGANKVLLEAEGSGNLLYLPVDQLMKRGSSGQSTGSLSEQEPTVTEREDARLRRGGSGS